MTETEAAPRSEGRIRRLLPTVVLVIATVVTTLAILANWADRQLLDTDAWTDTSTQLIQDPRIKDAVAEYAVDELYANVDVAGELEALLPEPLKGLSAPAAGGLRDLAQRLAREALDTARFEDAWEQANRVAHSQFVALVEHEDTGAVRLSGNSVLLDLRSLVVQLAQQVGLGDVASKIPPGVGTITVLKSDEIQTLQSGVAALRGVALLLSLLVPILFGAAIALARGRRRRYVIATGFALIAAGLLVLVARDLLGGYVVGSLAADGPGRPAAEAVWSIGTSLLAEGGKGAMLLGVPFILAGLLAGPTRPAIAIRRVLAPPLREWPAASFGVVAFAYLLLVLWQPVHAFSSVWFVLGLAVLLFVGVELLRRQTRREFPDASSDELFERLRDRVTHLGRRAQAGARRAGDRASSAVGTLRERGASSSETAATAATPAAPAPTAVPASVAPSEDSLARLERLVALRDAGALTDEEFAEQKRLVLGGLAAEPPTEPLEKP